MTQHDYYRAELNGVLSAGPHDDEDWYRVKVHGKAESKWLNITTDQVRVLRDAMDETNPPSLLPLDNGCRVVRADVSFTESGTGDGYVIADVSRESAHEYVTWHVTLQKGQCRWGASHGEYCSTMERAQASFDRRRGVAVAE